MEGRVPLGERVVVAVVFPQDTEVLRITPTVIQVLLLEIKELLAVLLPMDPAERCLEV